MGFGCTGRVGGSRMSIASVGGSPRGVYVAWSHRDQPICADATPSVGGVTHGAGGVRPNARVWKWLFWQMRGDETGPIGSTLRQRGIATRTADLSSVGIASSIPRSQSTLARRFQLGVPGLAAGRL